MQGSDFVAHAVDIAASELISIATPGQGLQIFVYISDIFLISLFNISCTLFTAAVSEVQLNRAKESTKSAVLMNLESRVLSLSPTHSVFWMTPFFGVVFTSALTYELKAEASI